MAGKFVISLDFEKYWGVRDHCSIEDYNTNLNNVDFVVSKLLNIFHDNEIHATWAIVGMMLYDNKEELVEDAPLNDHLYMDKNLSPYSYIHDNELEYKFHFSKNTIIEIKETPYQEIASHTFSHYYCLDPGQNIDDFRLDCKSFIRISKANDIEVKTIVFPKNQINVEYIDVLKEFGLQIYRGNEDHYIFSPGSSNKNATLKRLLRFIDRYVNITGHHSYKLSKNSNILNVKSSRFLAPHNQQFASLEKMRLKRIKKSMTYAAKRNEIFHLWWHPHNFGKNMDENYKFLSELLDHYKLLNKKYDFESKNIYEVAMGK